MANHPIQQDFNQGFFAQFYLSPSDEHGIHMPEAATLTAMRYIPGHLFSVRPTTMRRVTDVLARNERVVLCFKTESGATLVVIAIGALLVGSIVTTWSGRVRPRTPGRIDDWHYDPSHTFQQGERIGHFEMGSSVVTLSNTEAWRNQAALERVEVGHVIARTDIDHGKLST